MERNTFSPEDNSELNSFFCEYFNPNIHTIYTVEESEKIMEKPINEYSE